MTEYPEHEKLSKVKDKSQVIGEFLDWMPTEGYHISRYDDIGHAFNPGLNINELLAEYFDIDLNKLEDEKRQMLAELRKANDGA